MAHVTVFSHETRQVSNCEGRKFRQQVIWKVVGQVIWPIQMKEMCGKNWAFVDYKKIIVKIVLQSLKHFIILEILITAI